jgi:hypothetical protein
VATITTFVYFSLLNMWVNNSTQRAKFFIHQLTHKWTFFKTIHLGASWWIKNFDNIKIHGVYLKQKTQSAVLLLHGKMVMQTYHHVMLYISSLSFKKMPKMPLNFSYSDKEICRLNCQISPSASTALRRRETTASVHFFTSLNFLLAVTSTLLY